MIPIPLNTNEINQLTGGSTQTQALPVSPSPVSPSVPSVPVLSLSIPVNVNQIPVQPSQKKTDLKEPGIVKFAFYHMNGCGHCANFIKIPGPNGKTKFQSLVDGFANDPGVQILDFLYGRDKEANKFTAFPMIYIISDSGTQEYNGPLEINQLADAINKHK
jgi:hypothetical protein